jgi:hypothetical protein
MEAARRPRHLMDPAHPVRTVNDASLTRVQQWVASVLTVTTVAHLAAGLVAASFVLPAGDTAGRAGLSVIAGAFGMLGVAGALAIHGRSIASPWLLCGFLPGAVGLALLVLRA